MTNNLAAKPAHVPDERVVDFDMYSPEGWQQDVHLAWKNAQDTLPSIFWTPRQGGHWVVTRAEDIKHIVSTYQDFSSRASWIPEGLAPFQLPINLDPPEHTRVRKLLMAAFQPKKLRQAGETAHAIAIDILNEIYPKGECEFVSAFATVMPISAFISMWALPIKDVPKLRELGLNMTKIDQPEVYNNALQGTIAYLRSYIDERRKNPGTDALSTMLHTEVDGRKLTDEEAENLAVLVLGAGMDTVVSSMSFMAYFLANNPQHKKQLIENPKLIPNAVEEMMRRFGTSNLARKVDHDLIYNGVNFAEGDMVCLPFPLAGLDDTATDNPLEVDFTRQKVQHSNFGGGAHFCLGAPLARRELTIFLEEWLARMPDFRVKQGTDFVVTTGLVNSSVELWLEWDPKSA